MMVARERVPGFEFLAFAQIINSADRLFRQGFAQTPFAEGSHSFSLQNEFQAGRESIFKQISDQIRWI